MTAINPPFQDTCVHLNGNSDVVSNNASDMSFDSNKSFTVAGWIMPSSFASTSVLLGRGSQYSLGLGTDGKITASRADMTTPLKSSNAIILNKWSHVAMTYDGTTLKLFINGDVAGSVASSSAASENTDNVVIGSDGNSGHYFTGRISEFEIFNYGRHADGLEDTMYMRANQQAGLVAYFVLSDIPPSDVSGNNHPIGLSTYANYHQVATGLHFPKNMSESYANCTVNTGMSPTSPSNQYTISAWIYPSDIPSEPTSPPAAFLTIDDGTNKLWMVFGHGLFQIYSNNTIYQSNGTIDEDQWHFVTVTCDNTANELKLYIDGSLDQTYSLENQCPFPSSSKPAIKIGQSSSTSDYYGFIQSVRIYSDVRTATEIQNWMNEMPVFEEGVYASFGFSFIPANDNIGVYDVALQGTTSIQEQLTVIPGNVAITGEYQPAKMPPVFEKWADNGPMDISEFDRPPAPMSWSIKPDNLKDNTDSIVNEIMGMHSDLINHMPAMKPDIESALREQLLKKTQDDDDPIMKGHRVVIETVGDEKHLIHYYPGGKETLVTGAKTPSHEELLWDIRFLVTLIIGLFNIFFSVGTGASKGITKIVRRMLKDPKTYVLVTTFIEAPTVNHLYSIVTGMYSNGWLKQLMWVLFDSLSFWAILRMVGKIASGAAVGWIIFAVSMGALVVQLIRLLGEKPGEKTVKRKVTLSMYNVGQGDCFTVSTWEQEDKKDPKIHNILIDTGKNTLGGWKNVESSVPQTLDAVVVTHTDADHIDGAAAIFKHSQKTVSKLWFNSAYNHFGVAPPTPPTTGEADEGYLVSLEGLSEEERSNIESLRQASYLTYYAKQASVPILETKDGSLPRAIGFLPFNIICPSSTNVSAYYNAVSGAVHSGSYTPDASGPIINRSSIILTTTFLKDGVDILFTGDAHDTASHPDITTALGMPYTPPLPNTKKFKFLKVPHHGSRHSEDQNFYKKVYADYYLICNGGSFPTLDCLEWIVAGAHLNGQTDFKIYLTNTVDATITSLQTNYPPASYGNYNLYVLSTSSKKMDFIISGDGDITEPSNVTKKI